MRRYTPSHFVAFGVLPVLNAVALLIYGLEISTVGDYGEGETIPALVILVALCLLVATVAAVKRGHDLGWTTLRAVALVIGSFMLFPALLLLLAYLACAKGQPDRNRYGPPEGIVFASAMLAATLLAAPWLLLRILAAAYQL